VIIQVFESRFCVTTMFEKLIISLVIIIFGFQAAAQRFQPKNTQTEIQLGLNGIASYGSPIFANAMYMETRGWRAVNAAKFPILLNQIDDNGYPRFLTASQVLYVQPGNDSGASRPLYGGKISVTWEGHADVRIVDARYLKSSVPATGLVNDGKRFYDNGSFPNGIRLEIHAIDSLVPLKNICIWLNDPFHPTKTLDPAEQNGNIHTLYPLFAKRFGVDAFYMFRFMDLTDTNHSNIVSWSDRRKPNHCFQKGKIGNVDVGISYELAIDICNKLGKDMWINVPAMADKNFVQNLAKLIEGYDPDKTGCKGLNKNLRCYVEYANEVGWAFWQSYCSEQAKIQGLESGRHFAAMQKARVASWFREVVGVDNERFKIAHCIQSSNLYHSDIELDIACKSFGPTLTPSGKPDLLGITSYVSNQMEEFVFESIDYSDKSKQKSELKKFFAEFERRSLGGASTVSGVDFTSGISSVGKTMSEKYQLPLIVYEGGSGMGLNGRKCEIDRKIVPANTPEANCDQLRVLAEKYGGSANYVDFFRAVHADARMAKIFEICFNQTKAAGVKSLSQFGEVQDVNGNINWGYWACLNDLKQPTRKAYRYKFWLDWHKKQKTF